MTPSLPEPAANDNRRSARKREAILAAATTTFFRKGYLGTSMDEIAALAAVSKQTVYKHFADKERLFTEIVVGTVTEASGPVALAVLDLRESVDLETDLRDLARRQLAIVMTPRLLQLRRLVIGEAGRFPELGRTFYERGPERTIEALATAFRRLARRGMLRAADPRLAAAHFNWLVMSIPLNQAMFLGDDEPATAVELDRYADAGVRAFLAAYGRGSSSSASANRISRS
ncbi:MAG TPA: TetR/AcrR family transcriptional regulator [Candidatus Limnocylindrales bacterium]|nr:TetR/AcrR family transcriptional regulator [Candidatus Limnocylindrales bacterium]